MKILGVRVDNIDMIQALCLVQQYIGSDSAHQIVTVNAEILYNASQDRELAALIENADLVTPDGSGIVWAANVLGEPLKERVTGIDLVLEICRQAAPNQWKVFLLGGKPGVAHLAGENLKNKYPGLDIAGIRDGYFQEADEDELIEEINASKAQILFAGLGSPKQESWLAAYKTQLKPKVLLGVGGSFDVISGQLKRAPGLFQKLGLEWLYRIIRQPWRFKRALAIPKFQWAVKKSQWERNNNKKEVEKHRK